MIDRHPALIVRCASTEDVAAAVNFGRDNDLVISVRGGGHSTPGYSTCDGGIVIDLGPMNGVDVDPAARTARVQGGARWADLDARHAGARSCGHRRARLRHRSCGGLRSAAAAAGSSACTASPARASSRREVVIADGSVVRASADENADLFWGLRGGGGNFGVVTEFEFQPAPRRPDRDRAACCCYPRAQARELMRVYRDFIAQAPDQVCGGLALMTAPPEEFVPEECADSRPWASSTATSARPRRARRR